MITAVDTSVLIDIFRADMRFGMLSAEALRKCVQEGRVVVCDIVWAELAAVFPSRKAFDETMRVLPVAFSPLGEAAPSLAGETWRQYRARGGTRKRLIPDFIIGAHAMTQCERLLTRDRGFYREYFTRLRVLDPAVALK